MESTRPDNSRVNKMAPQWKEDIRNDKPRWIDRVKSDQQILGVIYGEELANE